MNLGMGDEPMLVEAREELRERFSALTRELDDKRKELARIRRKAERAARAREASLSELDRAVAWKGRLDAGALTDAMAELALRRSMLHAEASLAQLRLMTVQNQVQSLEWSLRQLEHATSTVR